MSDPIGLTSSQYQNQEIYDTIMTELLNAAKDAQGSPNQQAGILKAIEIIAEIKKGDWND